MEEMEKLESLEFRVFLEGLVPWAPLEIRDQWEIREQKDLLEFLDPPIAAALKEAECTELHFAVPWLLT